MTLQERVLIEQLELDDIPRAMELVTAANWNQTPRDWQRLIEYQRGGCFKAVVDRQLVGTVTTTCYGRELAWIGMMLVDPARRRQGIGTTLMQHAVSYLRDQGVPTIKLDATPAGLPLYIELGFQAEHDFQRWMRPSVERTAPATRAVEEPTNVVKNFNRHAELDGEAFGVDRLSWLSLLASDCSVVEDEGGFAMLRSGRFAHYLGPIVAHGAEAAQRFVTQLLSSADGPVVWDVPYGNAAASALATTMRCAEQRTLTRMWLGEPLSPRALERQFALCDPATG